MLRRRDGVGRAASTEVEAEGVRLGRPDRMGDSVGMAGRPDAQPLAAATDCSWRETGRTREISSVRLALHAPPRFVTSGAACVDSRRVRA
eukprot:scaffold98814_cov73-Phaeocystis_antarctica.AAC.17